MIFIRVIFPNGVKKRLLIIGGAYEQIPAYKLAKKMGLNVVGTDVNPNAPALKLADDKLICSTRNAKETLKSVLQFSKRKKIDGIMTIANDVPYTVSLVAKKLKLPGIPPSSAKYASNKIFMKKLFLKNHVPTPKFHILRSKKEFLEKSTTMKFPFILKPSDGRGSRGVLLIDESIDLSWAWKNSLSYSQNKKLLIEEFVPGDQMSVEGIFIKNIFHAISFSDRNYTNLISTKPFIIEDGGVIPSKYKGKILVQISKIIEKASKSIGIDVGSVKADIVISKNGPMIIELAARLSGNYLATHHIPMAYGVDIVSAVINLSLGNKINLEDIKPRYHKFFAARYFFPNSGKIKKIDGIKKVKKLKFVKMFEIYRKKNDHQPIIKSHVDRAGMLLCEGKNYPEAEKRSEKTRNLLKFEIKNNKIL